MLIFYMYNFHKNLSKRQVIIAFMIPIISFLFIFAIIVFIRNNETVDDFGFGPVSIKYDKNLYNSFYNTSVRYKVADLFYISLPSNLFVPNVSDDNISVSDDEEYDYDVNLKDDSLSFDMPEKFSSELVDINLNIDIDHNNILKNKKFLYYNKFLDELNSYFLDLLRDKLIKNGFKMDAWNSMRVAMFDDFRVIRFSLEYSKDGQSFMIRYYLIPIDNNDLYLSFVSKKEDFDLLDNIAILIVNSVIEGIN